MSGGYVAVEWGDQLNRPQEVARFLKPAPAVTRTQAYVAQRGGYAQAVLVTPDGRRTVLHRVLMTGLRAVGA